MSLIQSINENARRIPVVVKDLHDELNSIVSSTPDRKSAIKAVYNKISKYYKDMVWDIEKEEWNKMSNDDRYNFAVAVYNHILNN